MSVCVGFRQQRRPLFPIAVFLLLAVGLLVMFSLIISEHAAERAGSLDAWGCTNNGGTLGTMYNPQTGRNATICKLPDGSFWACISEGSRCVTLISKEKLQRLEQVVQYLRNRGYVQP